MGLEPTKWNEKGSQLGCGRKMNSGAELKKVESAVENLRPLALSDPERAREQISVRQNDAIGADSTRP